MISSSSTDTTKSRKIQENSKNIESFQCSKKKNDLIISLNSSAFNIINNSRTNLSLNTISNLKNNSSVESRNISNNSYFICVNHKIIKSNENSNNQKTEKAFLRKKTKNYFNVENICQKKTKFYN